MSLETATNAPLNTKLISSGNFTAWRKHIVDIFSDSMTATVKFELWWGNKDIHVHCKWIFIIQSKLTHIIYAKWNLPLLSIGPVHFHFKVCWMEFFIFNNIFIGHSVSKQWRPWSDAIFCGVCSGSALAVCLCPTKRMLGLYGLKNCMNPYKHTFISKLNYILIRVLENKFFLWESSDSVVECLTRDRGTGDSSLTSVTTLWSLSKTHLSYSLELVQPRKTRPCLTERLFMGQKNQIKQTKEF